jgi:hypothetical protein
LERINQGAFCESGLKSIVIPSSVVFLGQSSFSRCRSLESVRFENGSRLERLTEDVFDQSRVNFRFVYQEFTKNSATKVKHPSSAVDCKPKTVDRTSSTIERRSSAHRERAPSLQSLGQGPKKPDQHLCGRATQGPVKPVRIPISHPVQESLRP